MNDKHRASMIHARLVNIFCNPKEMWWDYQKGYASLMTKLAIDRHTAGKVVKSMADRDGIDRTQPGWMGRLWKHHRKKGN